MKIAWGFLLETITRVARKKARIRLSFGESLRTLRRSQTSRKKIRIHRFSENLRTSCTSQTARMLHVPKRIALPSDGVFRWGKKGQEYSAGHFVSGVIIQQSIAFAVVPHFGKMTGRIAMMVYHV